MDYCSQELQPRLPCELFDMVTDQVALNDDVATLRAISRVSKLVGFRATKHLFSRIVLEVGEDLVDRVNALCDVLTDSIHIPAMVNTVSIIGTEPSCNGRRFDLSSPRALSLLPRLANVRKLSLTFYTLILGDTIYFNTLSMLQLHCVRFDASAFFALLSSIPNLKFLDIAHLHVPEFDSFVDYGTDAMPLIMDFEDSQRYPAQKPADVVRLGELVTLRVDLKSDTDYAVMDFLFSPLCDTPQLEDLVILGSFMGQHCYSRLQHILSRTKASLKCMSLRDTFNFRDNRFGPLDIGHLQTFEFYVDVVDWVPAAMIWWLTRNIKDAQPNCLKIHLVILLDKFSVTQVPSFLNRPEWVALDDAISTDDSIWQNVEVIVSFDEDIFVRALPATRLEKANAFDLVRLTALPKTCSKYTVIQQSF